MLLCLGCRLRLKTASSGRFNLKLPRYDSRQRDRNFTTSYSYDAASNRTGFTDPENGATAYVYDTLNRLQTLTPPSAISGGSFGFGYDALSRRMSLTRPNAVNTAYSYDNLSRLLSVTHVNGGTTLDGASYTVDNVGNRLTRTPLPGGTTTTFGYDNIYELLSATQGGSPTETYTYDPVGNRLSNLAGSGWSNNISNELNTRPGVTYTYDNNGNMLTSVAGSNTTTYAWDFENRLISVALPGTGGTVSFKYDPFGRRIEKTASSATSIFAYDGDNLVEETNASGAVVARYEPTQNIDEPLAMLRGGSTSYFHADGLGSITSLSNAAGSVAQTYQYDSFGKQTASTGSLTNPFQYTGRESDPETGLYYYRARYYDPQTGRFIREDPTKAVIRGLNFYAYVHNNAPNFLDPKGRGPNDWLKKIGEGLKFGHEIKEQIDKALDWTFCGLFALTCTDSGINLKYDISQAQGTGADAFINSTEALARSVGANSASDLNRKVCIANDPCRHFLEDCTKFAAPNPF